MGRSRHLRLAGSDDPARQGDGGEWPIFRKPERWPLSQAQDFAEDLKWGCPLSGVPIDLAHELLTQSLTAWCVVASIRSEGDGDRKSTRLNSSHLGISYAVFCLKKKNIKNPNYK